MYLVDCDTVWYPQPSDKTINEKQTNETKKYYLYLSNVTADQILFLISLASGSTNCCL